MTVASFIASQRTEHGVPHAVSCRALEVPESTFYNAHPSRVRCPLDQSPTPTSTLVAGGPPNGVRPIRARNRLAVTVPPGSSRRGLRGRHRATPSRRLVVILARLPYEPPLTPPSLRQRIQGLERAVAQLQDQLLEPAGNPPVDSSSTSEGIGNLVLDPRAPPPVVPMVLKALSPNVEGLAHEPAANLAIQSSEFADDKSPRDDVRHHDRRFPDVRSCHTNDEIALGEHSFRHETAPVCGEINSQAAHRGDRRLRWRLVMSREAGRLDSQGCARQHGTLAKHRLDHRGATKIASAQHQE